MSNKTILVSAYSCEPNRGSEPGVGWDYVSEMSKSNKLLVVTRDDKKHILEKFENENLKFLFVKVPYFKKKSKYGIFAYMHYYLWQISVYFYVKNKINWNDILLVHHITFVNSWLPSFLGFYNKPFIWGPIGEHPQIPINYIKHLRSNKILFKEYLRVFARKSLKKIDPFYLLTVKKADKIICIDQNTADSFSGKKTEIMPAISIDSDKFLKYNKKETTKFTIYWCGNFIYWKGIYLALDAFLKFSDEKDDVQIVFIGDGAEKASFEKKVANNCKIKFENNLDQNTLFEKITEFDIFLFPSFEGGGMVVLEAMAMGTPVICLDFGGPGIMVDNYSGQKVVYDSYYQTVEDLSKSIEVYYNNRELVKEHGKNARKRVNEKFKTQAKINHIKDLYRVLLK